MRVLVCCAMMALSADSAQAADTVTLTCTGTEEISGNKVSIGITVDLKAQRVTGSPLGSEVISVKDTRISFGQSLENSEGKSTLYGQIDRISGNLSAAWEFWPTGKVPMRLATWSLNCRPTQRLF